MGYLWLAVLTTLEATVADWSVELWITADVKGRAFPVDTYNKQCSLEQYNSTPCECWGGAARRVAALAQARASATDAVVAIDTGEYMYGRGLFFPAFRGNASSEFFIREGYDAFSLRYRDLKAFSVGTLEDGTTGLAAYIDTLPVQAVATNFNVSGTPLEGRVVTHSIVPLSGGRRLAYLGLLDDVDLRPMNPTLASRVVYYRKALHVEMARLHEDPLGVPELVVVTLPAGQIARSNDALVGSAAIVTEVAREVIGIHVILVPSLLVSSDGTHMPRSYWEHNWLGEPVLVAHAGGLGDVLVADVLHATLTLSTGGALHDASVREVMLNCSSPEDAGTRARLFEYHHRMDAVFSVHVGTLVGALPYEKVAPGECVTLHGSSVCGLRVAEDPLGNLVADAMRWSAQTECALANGGMIRAALPAGAVSQKELVEMLPFQNEVTIVRLSAADLFAVLEVSISGLAAVTAVSAPHGRFLQVAGFRFEWWYESGGIPLVHAVQLEGSDGTLRPLSRTNTSEVTCAVPSFLASGGDGYSVLGTKSSTGTGLQTAVVLADYFAAAAGVLDPRVEGRISRIAKPRYRPATVNIGLLAPMFSPDGTIDLSTTSCRAAFLLALNEINDKQDGVADTLLPFTQLRFAYRDSKCDPIYGLRGAVELSQNAFGDGVSAIIGAACSSASTMAATAVADMPILSSSATAATLSHSTQYPSFARVVPSDNFQTQAMVDLLVHLWGYTRVALVSSTDAYGAAGAKSFTQSARAVSLEILADVRCTDGEADLSLQLSTLRNSGARVIVIICPDPPSASRFLAEAYAAGIGGPGYLWLGADAVTQPQTFDSVELAPSATQRERIAQGFFGTTAAEPSGTRYDNFLTRLRAMPSTSDATSPGSCNLQLDDEGGSYLWAGDHDGNASTQLVCAGFNATSISEWAAYEYDAVYALAHAIHDLLEVQQKSAIVGAELIAALMERVSFEGVTGLIDLHTGDSNGVYGAHSYRGDRRVGVVYDVKNVDASGQLVTIGRWAPCATCSFAQRWEQVAPLVYSTGGATSPRPEVLVADPSSNSAGPIIAIAVSATFGLTLAVLLSWRRIVNISVKKIEQWWGLPAVKKSNEAEKERKCCSFWFVPADFVVELAGAIGEAAGAEEEKSSSGSNSGGNRRSKFLAQYLDASTPTTTLSRCFARLQQVREATSSLPTAKVHPAADGAAPKLHRQRSLERWVSSPQESEREELMRLLTDVRKSEGPAFARAIAASNLTFRALKKAGVLVRREIYVEDAFRGKYAQEYLAVSHRWMIAEAPDAATGAECAQLDAIAKHLLSQPELTRPRFVWFDFWCMPQHSRVDHTAYLFVLRSMLYPSRRLACLYDAIASVFSLLRTYATAPAAEGEGKRKRKCRRTPLEDESFYWMLENMSMLYVGCAVLILLDRAYQSRFWTSFEAWLALRTATAEGLVNTPCPTDTGAREGGLAQLSPRASVATVYGAPGALIQSLQEEWAMCTREEAREKLRSPDVSVSNGKDKEMQLGRWEGDKVIECKIFELDDLAQEVLAPDSSTRESEKLRRIRTAKQRRLLARAKEVSRLSQSFVRRSRED